MSRRTTADRTAVLEISPRLAKVLIVSTEPVKIQQVNASVLPDQLEDAVAALRALLSAQPLGTPHVGLLIGRESCSLRTLELPSTNPQEIASMLELQLGKLTPYPRAEILSAWSTIGSFREGYTSVLLAMTRKTFIDSILQFLKTKGITPAWVGLSTEGLQAWWMLASKGNPPSRAGEGLTAIIDVDAHTTDCAVLLGAQVIFTHNIPLGAEQVGATDQAKLRWVGELIRLPRILSHEEVRGQLARGIMTGLTQGLHDAVDQLTNQWGIPVETIDALTPCAPSAQISDAAAKTRVSYAALAGVAMRGEPPRLDLIPKETRVLQALDVRAKHLARLTGSLVVVLVLAAMVYLERIVLLRYQLSAVQDQLMSLEQTSAQILERKQLMQRIREWLAPSRGALASLQALAAATDGDMTLTSVTFSDGAPLKIRGTAGAVQQPYQFVERLKTPSGRVIALDCYVASAKSSGSRGAEFEVICGGHPPAS